MTVLTKTEVQAALSPYHSLVRKVVNDAWAEVRQTQALRGEAGLAPLLYSRTTANLMFDAIARRAIPAFHAEAGAMLLMEAQTFKVIVGGVILRFKKGGDDKLGCNIPTQAALAFAEADGVLPGMPPECGKVEVIWRANSIGTALECVLVVARDGDRLLWDYEIAPNPSTDVVPLPNTPQDPNDDDAGDLVKPKSKPAASNENQ